MLQNSKSFRFRFSVFGMGTLVGSRVGEKLSLAVNETAFSQFVVLFLSNFSSFKLIQSNNSKIYGTMLHKSMTKNVEAFQRIIT